MRRKGRLDSRYEIEDISSTFRKKKAQLVVRDFFSNLLLFDNEDSSQVCFKKHKKTGQLLLLGIGDHLSLKLMILMMIKVRLSSQKPMDAQ